MKTAICTLATGIALAVSLPLSAQASEDVMVVYDASGSMWGQIDEVTKIEIAREVMGDLLDDWNTDINLGLVAYGHRREGDCSDIETVVPVGPVDRDSFLEAVNDIAPLGRTPLAAAVEHAAEELLYRENPATVVLISDGIESCQADPCALSAQLAEKNLSFTTHVIGFDLEADEHEHLSCIAENTGGMFLAAQDAAELSTAMQEVGAAIAEPEPTPEPEPEPESLPEATISGPETAVAGESFSLSWSEPVNRLDRIAIAPAEADAGSWEDSTRAGDNTGGDLTAPAEPGLYELRYILNEGDAVLAAAPIEIVATSDFNAGATLTVPESAEPGESVTVAWTGGSDSEDQRITLARAEQALFSWIEAQPIDPEGALTFTMPETPGSYEFRYLDVSGQQVLSRATIEVR